MDDRMRFDGMDALRSAMMLLVVLFHAALPYMSTRGPEKFKDPSTSMAFDLFVYFVLSFNMPVFFLTAGFFAALVCKRAGVLGFVRNRFMRIVIPLVAGWIVLPPLTRGAYHFAEAAASTASLAAGLDAVLAMNWLRWNKMYHLWFLVVLVALYGIGLLLRAAFLQLTPARRTVLASATRRLLSSALRPLMLAAVLWLEILPALLASDESVQLALLAPALVTYLMLGWMIFECADLEALGSHGWTYLLAGAAFLPPAAWTQYAALAGPESHGNLMMSVAAGGFFCLMSACMIFGLLGIFLARFSRPSRFVRYLSDASYWIYLVHLPLVVLIGGSLSTTQLPAGIKFAATVAVAMPILLLSYQVGVRSTPIGTLLNGRRRGRALAGAPASAG